MHTITLVTSRFPFPSYGGFENKNRVLIEFLHQEFNLNVIFILNKMPDKSNIQFLHDLGVSFKIYVPTIFDRIRGLFYVLLNNFPLQNALFYSAQAFSDIDKHDSEVYVSSVIRTSNYLSHKQALCIHDLADSLGYVYQKNSSELSFFLSLIYKIEGMRLANFEEHLSKLDNSSIFLFNSQEVDRFQRSSVKCVQHGVNESLFSRVNSTRDFENGFVFFGKLSVRHNVDMLKWLIQVLWPSRNSSEKLYVVGSGSIPNYLIDAINLDDRISLVGFMEDPYDAIRGSLGLVCPLITGGGVQNKILESMALGVPVITSPLAVSSFPQPLPLLVRTAESVQEWNSQLDFLSSTNVISDKDFLRKYAMSNFSWSNYYQSYRDVIESI